MSAQGTQQTGWLFGWLTRVPIVGRVASVYWASAVHDTTALPVDALAFSFLNDWMRPSLWHTWQEMTKGQAGIYIGRAPKSRVEAEWVARNHKSLPKERVDR